MVKNTTVRDMINLLKRFPLDTAVFFENQDGDLTDNLTLDLGYEGVIIKEF